MHSTHASQSGVRPNPGVVAVLSIVVVAFLLPNVPMSFAAGVLSNPEVEAPAISIDSVTINGSNATVTGSILAGYVAFDLTCPPHGEFLPGIKVYDMPLYQGTWSISGGAGNGDFTSNIVTTLSGHDGQYTSCNPPGKGDPEYLQSQYTYAFSFTAPTAPGHYTLTVTACAQHGGYNKCGSASDIFIISPPTSSTFTLNPSNVNTPYICDSSCDIGTYTAGSGVQVKLSGRGYYSFTDEGVLPHQQSVIPGFYNVLISGLNNDGTKNVTVLGKSYLTDPGTYDSGGHSLHPEQAIYSFIGTSYTPYSIGDATVYCPSGGTCSLNINFETKPYLNVQ